MSTSVRLRQLSKAFGTTSAVDRVDLEIAGGELFFLLGPSGCGKTTLLRMLAGFVVPDSGDILFADQRMNDVPPRDRSAALVFQTYALWPHLTVNENVAYGLRVRGLGRKELAQRVERGLRLVRLQGLGERRPTQLSGGQQQRVALARALVVEPRLLLLDEPLSNLDARLRDQMREEIRRLHQETGLTMVYVTHDQKEALTLASRVALMERGRLAQVGTPRELYDRPVSRFVADFLGDSNFLPGTVRGGAGEQCLVETAIGVLTTGPQRNRPPEGRAVTCSIRPHALTLTTAATAANRISGKVEAVTFLGETIHLEVGAQGGTLLHVVSLPHQAALWAGDAVTLSVPPEQIVILEE